MIEDTFDSYVKPGEPGFEKKPYITIGPYYKDDGDYGVFLKTIYQDPHSKGPIIHRVVTPPVYLHKKDVEKIIVIFSEIIGKKKQSYYLKKFLEIKKIVEDVENQKLRFRSVCKSCKKIRSCTYDANPYESDVNGDKKKVFMCTKCREESARDI